MSSSQIVQRAIADALLVAMLVAGCLAADRDLPSNGDDPTPTPPVTPPVATPHAGIDITPPLDESVGGGWLDWDGQGGWRNPPESALAASDAEIVVEAGAAMPMAAAAPAQAPQPAPTMAANQGQSSLRAGEVDDNADWDDYLLYRLNYAGPPVHDRDVSERYVVAVTNQQGRPVLDAGVAFYAGDELLFSARSDAAGQVLFFPRALGVSEEVSQFRVVAEKDDARREATLFRDETYRLSLSLAHPGRAPGAPVNLDVLFLIDSTGSMGDEIDQLQESIQEIAARIDRLPGQPEVRFAMTIYRDRGDLFVSRSFDFTPDVDVFSKALAEVEADGGGDTPESLNEALYHAIHAPEWRGRDSLQLIFLVADAPPHLDYAQDYDYAVEMVKAAERGIKIFPIASSGLDDQGEYIFRQIALFTQGRFIFLTYGPEGGPGDSTTHHVEDYTVQSLDDLVVRMVEEELAHQQ